MIISSLVDDLRMMEKTLSIYLFIWFIVVPQQYYNNSIFGEIHTLFLLSTKIESQKQIYVFYSAFWHSNYFKLNKNIYI